jgi:hypothetical protein
MDSEKMYVFDAGKVLHFECVFKHFCILHGLIWEHITTISSSQQAEIKGENHDIRRKTILLSSVASELEDLIDEFIENFMVKEVADATDQIRLSKADLRQIVWEYGHFGLSEEHFADYISVFVKKLHDAKSEEEKQQLYAKIDDVSNHLHVTRLERKKYLSGFLEKVPSEGSNQVK